MGIPPDGPTAGTLNKTGPGTVIINGNIGNTGGLAVVAGNALLGNGTAGGSLGTVPLNIGATGTVIVNHPGSSTIASPISGLGNLIVSPGLTVALNGNNSGFKGSISVTGATLVMGNATGVGSANMGLNNSTLTQSTNATNSTGITTSFSGMNVVGASTIDTNGFTMQLGVALSGSGTITRIGAGTLALGTATTGPNMTNTFFGGTFINTSGTLGFCKQIAPEAAMPSGSSMVARSPSASQLVEPFGLLQISKRSIPITVTGVNSRLRIGDLGGTDTYDAGNITVAASAGLAKFGSGTLVLTGQNVFRNDGVTFTSTSGVTYVGGFPGRCGRWHACRGLQHDGYHKRAVRW